MFELFKLLTWCCMPYTWVLLGMFFITLWLLIRGQVRPALSLLVLNAFLWAISLPQVVIPMGYALESKYPPLEMKDIPQADALVILGGGIGTTEHDIPYPECYPASDRAIMAARLWHAKKTPIIIPTGAGATRAEQPLFEALGIPSHAILCENAARNTAENATHTIALLKQRNARKVLVVTSSWHLPRTMLLFTAPDITFIPVGCDYEASLARALQPKTPFWQKLPSAQNAALFGVYLKEFLGIAYTTLLAQNEQEESSKVEN